jgi:hypothetical protein
MDCFAALAMTMSLLWVSHSIVMPRAGGASSIRQRLDSNSDASGILDRPVKPDDDSGELFDI